MTSAQMDLRSQFANPAPSQRIASIDIFRGLTMAVMIFVNALSDVKGMPWWTEHAPASVDVMTYVDMVFPFFLFILGVSMPLAVAQRLKRNPSHPMLWRHILSRSLYLVTLGYILANADKVDASLTHMNGGTWGVLALLGAALYLNVYGRNERFAVVIKGLRFLGLAAVIILFAIFRRTTAHGDVAWLDFSYPEILGLIGFSYFATSILFLSTRRWPWASAMWFAVLTAFCALSTMKAIPLPGKLPLYIWPFGNGSMPSLIMAGVVTSQIFPGAKDSEKMRGPIRIGIGLGVLLLVVGRLLTPLGISKIRATPTWCLYSAGAAVLLFTALYWICDIKGRTAWAAFVRAAGANTLLTYLLPDLWYFCFLALGAGYFETHFSAGFPGLLKTLAFTGLMLLVASMLTRARVRLQL